MTQAPRQPYLIFAIVALALLMSSIDGTIVAVGLPTIMAELNTNLAWIGWTLTSYMLTSTIIMPIAGKMSDEWGRKRLFLGAVALFTLSSMACGLAPNVYWLIIFRVLQAIGGGAFLPSATGIVSDAFGDRRMTALGLFTSVFPLGGILGPNLGGFIIDNMSWRWVFYINGPIGLALLGLGVWLLPSSPATAPAGERKRIDLAGAGLFAGAMVAILYAMTTWANRPEAIDDPAIWGFLALGVALMGVFLWHESRTASPMLEIDLLRRRPFMAANAYNFIYGAVVFGFFSFIPYYATVAYNMTAGESGLILTPRSLTMAVMSTISSFFLIRFGYRLPMIVGTLFVALSLFMLGQGFHDVALFGVLIPNMALLAAQVLIAGFGMGVSGPASNNAALDLIPEKVAAVAGLRGMFRSTGGVLGTSGLILALSHFPDKAHGLQQIFLFLSGLIVLTIPLVFLIPDAARQRHLDRKAETDADAGGGAADAAASEPVLARRR
ncbi:MAG: DHA2 family efflux MFS transporter permease subunit [Chloroflexi bacterium]|nr:DHA2 family efflux MFS transporter permease subunit [Chloroflexota bacterium]